MIVRSHRKTNFTIISNMGMDDTRLSLKAKGLLAYLLTKPDNWQVNDRHLSSIGPDGRSAIQAALKELEATRYLVREKYQDEKGQWLWRSTVYDEPWTENPATENQHESSVKYRKKNRLPVAGKSVAGKSSHIISTDVTNTEKKEEVNNTSLPDSKDDALPSEITTTKQPDTKNERPRDIMFDRLVWIVGIDPDVITSEKRGELNQTLGILRKAGYNADHLTTFWNDYWKQDWRRKKDPTRRPSIQEVRNEIGKVRKDDLIDPIPDKFKPPKMEKDPLVIDPFTGKTMRYSETKTIG